MELTDIQNHIIQRFRPFCFTFASPLATSMCKENELTPAELLKPFFDTRKEQLIFNQSILKDFVVDVFDAPKSKELTQVQYEERKELLLNYPPSIDFVKCLIKSSQRK